MNSRKHRYENTRTLGMSPSDDATAQR